MTSSQKRALRAGYTPPPVLCACGHTRGTHRYQPQIGACPTAGCDCTGYHAVGEPMPVPKPPPEPDPAPVAPPRRVLRRPGLALLFGMLAMGAGPLPPPHYPTKGRP